MTNPTQPTATSKPKRRPQPKDWQCQECGLRMTLAAAERASRNVQGCRRCGGADIDMVAL